MKSYRASVAALALVNGVTVVLAVVLGTLVIDALGLWSLVFLAPMALAFGYYAGKAATKLLNL